MEQLTVEEVQRNISAAFDSVHLINQIITEDPTAANATEGSKGNVERNVGHLTIMIGKEWFANGLTEEQRQDIDNCIANGNTYISA